MATGKLAHLGCKFVSSKVVLSFYVHKSVHRKSMLIIVQPDATVYSLFIAASDNRSELK